MLTFVPCAITGLLMGVQGPMTYMAEYEPSQEAKPGWGQGPESHKHLDA